MTKHEAIEVLEEVKMLDDSMFAYSQVYNDALDMAIEALKAQEPNTRRWVKEHERTNHWHCSCCGCVQGITARIYRYCPNCGARMEVCEE